MKRLSFLILFFLYSQFILAQTGIYRTYDDYVNNKLEDVGEYDSWFHIQGKVTLRFKKNTEKVKIPCAGIWGFKYKNELFRVDHATEQPYFVYSIGKIVYYENGAAHLEMLQNNKSIGHISFGTVYSFSKSINSEMISTNKQWKSFVGSKS